MKYILVFVLMILGRPLFAQYAGPIMDSLKKYQELIKNAKTPEERIRLSLQIQKIVSGKSAIDTAAIKNLTTDKDKAMQQRAQQVEQINKQKQAINGAKTRQDKYAAIQKMQALDDSIRTANKDAGKHAVLQEGLITLPHADLFLIDPLAPVDTSFVTVLCNYVETPDRGGPSSFNFSTGKAYMYRQNGIITIVAANDSLPEYASQNGVRTVRMAGHHDITGMVAIPATGGASYKQNNKFGFSFYYNPSTHQFAAGGGAGFIELKKHEQSVGALSFSCTNDPATWIMAGIAGPIQNDGNLVGSFAKTQNGFTVTYDGLDAGVKVKFSAQITLAPSQYEAFIEPADTAIYRKWIPQGPLLTDYPALAGGGKGNDLQLKVTLWDKQANKESAAPYQALIKLNNVSNMPGYCMNFPEEDKNADDKPDMRFDRADSTIYESWQEGRLTTKKAAGPQYVTVVSYDYGGIADVTADITTPEGIVIQAHLRNSANDTLTLPRRSNGSFIADYWKEKEHAEKKGDLADDEEIEVNDDHFPGDGLTLYEEYRGFLENRKHFRGSAEKKDMMVCNKIATPRSQDGINNCEAVLNQYGNHVAMHSHFKDDEFGKKKEPDGGEAAKMAEYDVKTPMKYDRCINYNYIEDLHITDQHGVVLMFADKALGFAKAVRKDGKDLGPPKNYYFLIITKDFDPKPKGWAETNGSVDAEGHVQTGVGTSKILTDEYARTLSHEMLHCFHIRHHGDEGDFGRYEFVYSDLGQSWEIIAKDGQKFLDDNGFFYHVHLYWEDDPTHEIETANTAVPGHKWHIYGQNSTHSGVEDCIMRYDVADGYIKGSDIYLMRGKARYEELSGINLCNSTIGTGVNSRDHKPIPRYGDAAPGRGDCIHQFCVSDKWD